MAKTDLWTTPVAIVTCMSTDLNNLANAGRVVSASAIDNRITRYKFTMLDLFINTQTARTAGAHVGIFVLPSVDATNYAFGSGTVQPDLGLMKVVFGFDAAVTARQNTRDGILIPPLLFYLCLENNSTQAFSATLNTLKYRLYSSSLE